MPKLRISKIRLVEFYEPSKLLLWDSTDGPDLFITITKNYKLIFSSNVLENQNATSAPINFNLDSNLIFQSGQDKMLLRVFDHDMDNEQLIQNDTNIQPGLFGNSPHTSCFFCTGCFSCLPCFAKFEITFDIIQ